MRRIGAKLLLFFINFGWHYNIGAEVIAPAQSKSFVVCLHLKIMALQ